MKAAIVTRDASEVEKLYLYLGKKRDTDSNHLWPGFYNSEWLWVWDGSELSGSSGLGTNSTVARQHPGIPMYLLTDFIKERES